ncbi:MAG: L,D-transpeptidase [Candidatus Aminicenantes bacterium]|nr:L,D-transpeptidase [Candidatus Aminicenantes bacterium]
MSVLERYNDSNLLETWKTWAEEAVRLSQTEGIQVILITKIDQTLTLYKNGRSVRTFAVSIGRDGLFDKKHAGDYATPEGKYRITKKNPASRYHKALLIDYPNSSDHDTYVRNRQNGLIPSGVGIGGRIEIHGGGNDVITDGCIGMADREIDLLYDLVDAGTPVTIIGSKRSLKSMFEEGNDH